MIEILELAITIRTYLTAAASKADATVTAEATVSVQTCAAVLARRIGRRTFVDVCIKLNV